MSKKLKTLVLFDSPYVTPRGYDFHEEFNDPDWETEYDVCRSLQEIGCEVTKLGIHNDIKPLQDEIVENSPEVVFNLAEVFNEKSHLDKNVVCLLEMLGIPYTGASLSDLLICNDKALSKKILNFHGINVPNFRVFTRNHKVNVPENLKFPMIVKPLREEASRGISRASVVSNKRALIKRIELIHKSIKMDAIVEEYIEGKELYVSILGSDNIKVLPPREMTFGRISGSKIGTYKSKWDPAYRRKWGIRNTFARSISAGTLKKIENICKEAYRALGLQCYARIDIRLGAGACVYVLEANANPCLGKYDEFARSAEKSGISYNNLMRRIIKLAFRRK